MKIFIKFSVSYACKVRPFTKQQTMFNVPIEGDSERKKDNLPVEAEE